MNDLTLICETCKFPINGDAGCIYALFREMRTSSDEIRWRTSHYAHFPTDLGDTYEITAGRIATWKQFAWWTAHLMEKNWFPLSDWDDLLRELAGEGTPDANPGGGVKIYEVYTDTECPRCGNTERNRDAGPYAPDPFFDDAMGAPPDPRVHLIWCGNCGKPFDAASEEVARAAMAGRLHYYNDVCPHPDCQSSGRSAIAAPDNVREKRGRNLAEYAGPCGHKWVTWWGGQRLDSVWPIERELAADGQEVADTFAALTQDWDAPA